MSGTPKFRTIHSPHGRESPRRRGCSCKVTAAAKTELAARSWEGCEVVFSYHPPEESYICWGTHTCTVPEINSTLGRQRLPKTKCQQMHCQCSKERGVGEKHGFGFEPEQLFLITGVFHLLTENWKQDSERQTDTHRGDKS